MPKECRNPKSQKEKIILLRDGTSSFIGYCNSRLHPGMINQTAYDKCRRKECPYLYIFRPECVREIPANKTRVYNSLSEIEIRVRFL